MGFFDTEVGQKWEDEAAGRLAKMIEGAGFSLRNCQTKGWGKQLAALSRRHGQETVDEVLTWLPKSITRPYIPHVRSASSFCSKFERLLAVVREEGGAGEDVVAELRELVQRHPLYWNWEPSLEDEVWWLARAHSGYVQWLEHVRDRELEEAVFGPPLIFCTTWRVECWASAGEARDFSMLEWRADNRVFRRLRAQLGLVAA